MNYSIWRSIGVVAAGLVLNIVVTTLVDVGLHLLHLFPAAGQPMTDGHALLASSYRVIITVGCAWLTARWAPGRPMAHVIVLGGIGTLLGIVGVVATWNLGLGPRWYPVSIALLGLPECWLGWWLFTRRVRAI